MQALPNPEPLAVTAVTDEQLEKINQLARRSLSPEEVFVFSVILCDNEIDRDFERFPNDSLEVLGELFLGSTGVFDHAPTAENQSARIFDTLLEQTGERNSVGEAYCRLRAWAYMVRCEKNADLILEIDAGIKKEVSVGCAVASILCSICGEEQKSGGCSHQKGQRYGEMLCHHLLVEPTDAYEWSFVAVPAQKRAGVTKRRAETALPTEDTVTVEKGQLKRLGQLAALGARYESELRQSVVKLGLLAQPELTAGTLKGIVAKLDVGELESLKKSFSQSAAQVIPLSPQLCAPESSDASTGSAFQI